MLRAIAKKEGSHEKRRCKHIKSVLSTVFIYAKNEGAFDGTNPVDGVLIPMLAREAGTDARLMISIRFSRSSILLPLLAKNPGCDRGLREATPR